MSTQKQIDLYYEDVVLGEERVSGRHTVTMADIRTFGEVTHDNHPLHWDEAFARSMGFDKPIAHGLFGLSLLEGLKSELKLYEHTSVASLGWDKVRFKRPVYPGDTLHVRVRFREKRPSRREDRGIVLEEVQLINQKGESVLDAEHATLLLRHPSSVEASEGNCM
jgi:acyl dehydratase